MCSDVDFVTVLFPSVVSSLAYTVGFFSDVMVSDSGLLVNECMALIISFSGYTKYAKQEL